MYALLEALFVTFLWSTSFVLINVGLQDMPALTFAGLRYTLGFLCLLPFFLRSADLSAVRSLQAAGWGRLIVLGLLFYSVTQGSVFLALTYVRSVTVSLFLSFTPALVALLGIFLLRERPGALQWSGIGLFLVGALAYFYPFWLDDGQAIGFVILTLCLFANAGSSILGRHVNRQRHLSPLSVTVISMGVGALVLLAAGLATHGLPRLSLTSWLIIGCLATVNTAFAFTLWNHTLRTLSATESSVINNTMLVQIAVLAWIFLGDRLNGQEIISLFLAAAGAVIVHLRSSVQN